MKFLQQWLALIFITCHCAQLFTTQYFLKSASRQWRWLRNQGSPFFHWQLTLNENPACNNLNILVCCCCSFFISQQHPHSSPGAHYLELPSSILTLWVNPVPYLFIFRSTSHGVFSQVFTQELVIRELWSSIVYVTCRMWKYFNNGKKRWKFMQTLACFHGKLKNPPHTSVLKIKRYRTELTQGYNWYGGSR